MWKWLIALSILLAACGTGEQTPEESAEAGDTPEAETSKDESEGAAEEKSEGSIDVDKGMFNVKVTLPKTLFEMEDGDFEEIKASAEEEGIGEVTDNGDGTITYKMSKSKHKEMMKEMEEEIESSLEEIREGGEYSSIQGVTANGDYSEFTLEAEQTAYEESFDGFAVFGIGVLGLYYQLFDGADPDDYSVVIHITDAATGEEFDTVEFPEVLDEMSGEQGEEYGTE